MNTRILIKGVVILFFCAISAVSFSQNLLAPVSSGQILEDGVKLSENSKYEEAINLYEKVSRSDTNYEKIIHEISLSYYMLKKYDEARKWAEKGLKDFPNSGMDFYLLIGGILDSDGKSEQAVEVYNKDIAKNPFNYYAHYNKGLALITLKKNEEAEIEFQKTLLINPYHTSSHFFLGSIYYDRGELVPAMMAFSTYLLMGPSEHFSQNAVKYLSSISKVTDEVLKNTKGTKRSASNFDLPQEILLSKVALDHNYKNTTGLEDPIVKQLQVSLEKLEYNGKDKSFEMQFYAPFYSKLFAEGSFESLVYRMFSGLKIQDIDKWNSRHKKEEESFIENVQQYFNGIYQSQVLDNEQRSKATLKYLHTTGKVVAKGSFADEAKEILTGKWEYYYPENGTLQAAGAFDNEGKKTGEWNYYYLSGVLKEHDLYKAGKLSGECKEWYDNENLRFQSIYKDDFPEGLATAYYFNGNMKSETQYANGKMNGIAKEYYQTGELNNTAIYKEDKKEGLFTGYYKNGKPEYILTYADGVEEGSYKGYSEDGALTSKGDLKKGLKEGLWTYYYNEGTVSRTNTYTNGDITGEYSEFFKNGKPSEKGIYYKGKPDGKIELFDEGGRVWSNYYYDRGKLKEVNFYNKTGALISNTTTRKGSATITFYDIDGNKIKQGYFNKDGTKDGEFVYYYLSGEKSQVENYNNDELEGPAIAYYLNGNKKFDYNYKKGELDGDIKEYYQNGKLKFEGWFTDGKKQGPQISYNALGDLTSNDYYLNHDINGYSEEFTPNRIKSYEYKYSKGWIESFTQFDSTGKVVAENKLKKGTGPYIIKHYSGKNFMDGNYKNYELDGVNKRYFFDGSLSSVYNYKNGSKEGDFKEYFYGGKVRREGNYKNGKLNGKVLYYFEDGKLSAEENYKKGNHEGVEKQYNEDGSIDKEFNYKEDDLDGPLKIYGEKGMLIAQLNYEKGVLKSYTYEDKNGALIQPIELPQSTGIIKTKYKNGNPGVEITYKSGMINGTRKFWFSNGKQYVDGQMTEGLQEGLKKVYYFNGNLASEETCYQGSLNGIKKTYYESGKLKAEESFYNDEMNGISKYYDEAGKLIHTRTYYYGILTKAN